MDESFLYKRIAEEIRSKILQGKLQPNDRLPSIRELTRKWGCTPGTIQRAYQELAQQGLIVSRPGRGTHVSGQIDKVQILASGPLRKATLVHKAESFLLEVLTSGYELPEIQQAFFLAMDHWRSLKDEPAVPTGPTIQFTGSHDAGITWISGHMDEIIPGTNLRLNFTGSLGGLIALAESRADLAGCHLLDSESGTYNLPYIRKLFPGKHMTLIRLAERRIGLILAAGNPLNIQDLKDLTRPGIRFVNRQAGSGTRVWLDTALERLGISGSQIIGYDNEKNTHSEVARDIAEGKADLGLGLESSARAFNLNFIFLTLESYDLVTYTHLAERQPLQKLFQWLASNEGCTAIGNLTGYKNDHTGEMQQI